MQLSILIPTYRSDLLAAARIAQACSWASPEIEVVIRDNSGNAKKRAMLEQYQRPHCNIVFAEPCDAVTNFAEVLKLARGDFVFFMADDDFGFDRAVAMLPGLIDQIGSDNTVAALTGAYMLDASKGSSIVAYQHVDADDAATRVAGYLAFEAANVLAYSPIRRPLVERVHAFMNSMPLSFSFHDQIMCLLYLLNGKFVPIKRLMYFYDVGEWEMPETAQKRDLSFYTASKADPALNKLHWFLCAFEGAALIRNSDMFPDMPMAARQPIADRWFSSMFVRFMKNPRTNFGSPLAAEADAFCEKWKVSAGRLSFQDMLGDICAFIALFSKDGAEKYFAFWNPVLNRQKPGTPPA
ncbi:MAG: glycosyltransferase family 2 protein [Pseudolabrys sp.]|nr:glycosyltransferase family 2 protein [Pseudolabrys sp.]